MADPDHLKTLRRGVDAWNGWRRLGITPDLSEADLREADLRGANLNKANLSRALLSRADLIKTLLNWANLSEADLSEAELGEAELREADLHGANLNKAQLNLAHLNLANLSGAQLRGANLGGANLWGAQLRGAHLCGAHLVTANLIGADLSGAQLIGADLNGANLLDADITGADLSGCHIHGISVWGLKLSKDTAQHNLIITKWNEPEITVDNIEVAQFIYLILNNEKIREVIDTITSKVVLILGRFTDERKAILDALRDELRGRNYLPILFDFEKSASRSIDETITLLARMARFVIADISEAKSVLQELRGIVPELPNVPVQPVMIASQDEPGMFDFYRHLPWFLPAYRYDTLAQLLTELNDLVIKPAEAKVLELRATAAATSLNVERDSRDPQRLAQMQKPKI